MDLKIFCTGGTFDKIYFDALSDYQIGEPQIEWIMTQANVDFDYAIESILKKDSLEISEQDRAEIVTAVTADNCERIIITHGTDTMPETATALQGLTDKTIVLVGAMQPARFRDSDALFNSGFAVAAARLLPVGVYIAMNGQIFNADQVQKNREAGLFEAK
ncbi:MAG: asparaginase domain-containing protein [Gammaproteobacteria bacterium]|jgi:L-asparaginase|nr:asparaginase domain-containing protein [Gammaproteobacteria bacterium]